jgi:hypothetical protein
MALAWLTWLAWQFLFILTGQDAKITEKFQRAAGPTACYKDEGVVIEVST